MSILLLDPPMEPGAAIVQRLLQEGDQVRVLIAEAEAERWRGLGAHVAAGDTADLDLVAAAATGVRTIVAFSRETLAVAGKALLMADPDRVVGVVDRATREGLDHVDHVVLVVPRKRFGRGYRIEDELVAEAVNAADDLAGNPREVLDLGEGSSWSRLQLSGPEDG